MPANLLTQIPADLCDEVTEVLLRAPSLRIERIVSLGHASPEGFWYDQDEAEWVVVLQGRARLRFEDDASQLELQAGDFVNIPAHKRHRVEWTDAKTPTVWLATHYRENAGAAAH